MSAVRRGGTRAFLLGAGLVALVPLWLGHAACSTHEDSTGGSAGSAVDVRVDRRVGDLLTGCANGGFYDRDLSSIVPILLGKLEQARPEPLKRAKEELGQLGSRAFPDLANAFQRYYTDLMRSAFLENVTDALAFNASDQARELELEALKHPQESVRGKALDGLQRHALPADFDTFASRLPIETKELRQQLVGVLFATDRDRAEPLVLDFLERGEERDLWPPAAALLASTTRPEIGAHCATMLARFAPDVAMNLAAAAARHGNEAGLERLRAGLREENPQQRLMAVTAAARGKLLDELEHSLLEDPSGEVRVMAASALGAEPLTEARRTWLRTALADESPGVRDEALRVLCENGDEQGLAQALAQLQGEPTQLQSALLALRLPLSRDPELARRAYGLLQERHGLEEHRPIAQRTATFKALAQLPLREAAEFLHRMGVEAGAERIEGLRAHDWLMIQAANTGLEGRHYLVEALASEKDPLRRIDLIDAIGAVRDDLARSALFALIEGPSSAPLEKLFTASILAKVGPSWDVAPRLKRVCFEMRAPEDAEARAGLQCLLWFWY